MSPKRVRRRDDVIVGALLSGGTFAVARYVSQPNDPVKVITPVSMLRADRAAILITCLTGAIAGAITGFYLGYSFQAGHRHGFDALAILRQPALMLALIGAIGGFVLSSAGLGLMASGASSWGRFMLTRAWLAGRSSLPLRLMRFLEDAYTRGVLRQVNGYYESATAACSVTSPSPARIPPCPGLRRPLLTRPGPVFSCNVTVVTPPADIGAGV